MYQILILVLIFFLQLQKTLFIYLPSLYFPIKLVLMLPSYLPLLGRKEKNPKNPTNQSLHQSTGTLILLSAVRHEVMPGDESILPLEHTCNPAPP